MWKVMDETFVSQYDLTTLTLVISRYHKIATDYKKCLSNSS